MSDFLCFLEHTSRSDANPWNSAGQEFVRCAAAAMLLRKRSPVGHQARPAEGCSPPPPNPFLLVSRAAEARPVAALARPGSAGRAGEPEELASAASQYHVPDNPAPRDAPGSKRPHIPGKSPQQAPPPAGAGKNNSTSSTCLSRHQSRGLSERVVPDALILFAR